jgi:hypothetical protein
MQNLANTTPGTAEAGGKKSLKKRAVSELEKYAVISAYLWVPRALSIFFELPTRGYNSGYFFANRVSVAFRALLHSFWLL